MTQDCLDDAAFQRQVMIDRLRQALKDMVSAALDKEMEFPLVVELVDVEGGRSTFLMSKECEVHKEGGLELSELWLCPSKIVFTDGGGRTLRGTFYDVPPQEAS